MSLRPLPSIGFLLFLLVVPVPSFAGLYDQIKGIIMKETAVGEVEQEVAQFINAVYKDKLIRQGLSKEEAEQKAPTTDDVARILRDEWSDVCGRMGPERMEKNVLSCQELVEDIKRIASDELKTRTAGRLLQEQATSYELPISDLPGRTMKLSEDMRAIISMWATGSGSIRSTLTGALVRTVSAGPRVEDDEDRYKEMFQKLATALGENGREQMIASVWRYQYGIRLVRGDRLPRFAPPYTYTPETSGKGTERQFLFKRWTEGENLEEKLMDIWNDVKAMVDDSRVMSTPLQQDETAYVIFPGSLTNMLPENVILWARIDGDPDGDFPLGDVGLQWKTPLEPVQPSLLTETGAPIFGGRYPPPPVKAGASSSESSEEPVDGMGLCTGPAGLQGYLCRPYTLLTADERCPVPEDLPSDAISLITCKKYVANPTFDGIWCCLGAKSGSTTPPQCRYKQTSTECVQAGGSPSATPEGCTVNGCPASAINPVWCCLKNQGEQCRRTVNSSECVHEGGSPSDDVEGCMTNGCKAPQEVQQYTAAGPDVCRELEFRDRPASAVINVQTECKLSIRCTPDCSVQGDANAMTYAKQPDGTVNICIQKEPAQMVSTYLLYHELVHAQYYCGKKPGETVYKKIPQGATAAEVQKINDWNSALCCEHEGAAYRAQCELMERDGVFAAAGRNINNIPFNAETCAEVLTDITCKSRQGLKGCYVSRDYPVSYVQQLYGHMKDNPAKVPANCRDLLSTVNGERAIQDQRVANFAEEIEANLNVCRPGEETRYVNRIGNNMCYIGRCVEQSVQTHRLTPGKMTSLAQEPIAPWDDPLTGTPFGNILMNPPLTQAGIPSYRPELLVREMETALCQAQGLPPRTPPILCAIQESRQLEHYRVMGPDVTFGVDQQSREQVLTGDDLVRLAPALGSRMGTSLYVSYLREASRSFAGVLTMAAQLLEETKKIRFPTQMCPAGQGLPPPPTTP